MPPESAPPTVPSDPPALAAAAMREVIREALDDSALTHTARSIGDIASGRVADDVLAALAEHGHVIVSREDVSFAASASWVASLLATEADSKKAYVELAERLRSILDEARNAT